MKKYFLILLALTFFNCLQQDDCDCYQINYEQRQLKNCVPTKSEDCVFWVTIDTLTVEGCRLEKGKEQIDGNYWSEYKCKY